MPVVHYFYGMRQKQKFRFCRLLAAYFAVISPLHVFAQELPKLPPEADSSAPLLSPEDVIPQKPAGDEAVSLGQGRFVAARKQAELEKLFAQLKRTADSDKASRISRQIQGLWAQSGSDTVDLLMQWAENALREEDYTSAMDFLDNVVALEPAFAEGWMRRASVHIMMNDIALAMVELNQVLRLETRHFNAMLQLGTIMEMTGRKDLALKAYGQALHFYPQMRRAQHRIGTLVEEKTSRAI